MKCEISLPKMQIQDYPPPPLLISEGIFFCAYVWYAHERLIIRWNKGTLIRQSTAVFFKDKRLLQRVVFPGKLRPVTFLCRLHLHKCSNYVPRLFPHPNPRSLHAASFFFFSFLLSNYFCSYHFPFMSAPITSLLAARGLRIQTRLAGRLADNIAINQRVVAPSEQALTGPHQGFLRLIMTGLRSLFAEMQCMHRMDSSTFNQIYPGLQLLMQSLKEPCNSITERLAPGWSPFGD